MRRSLFLSLALPFTVLSTKAAAQTCVGMPAFTRNQALQLSGGAAFADGATSFGGNLGYGAPKGLYGKAGIGTTSYDPRGSSFDLNLGAGYQLPLHTKRTAELCPIANLNLGWGPNDVPVNGVDMSSRTFSFGAATGVIVGRSASVQFVPNASLQFANSRLSFDNGPTSVSSSDSYGLLTLGTGFVFSSHFSLNPSISVPMGLEGGNTVFGLVAAYNFGR